MLLAQVTADGLAAIVGAGGLGGLIFWMRIEHRLTRIETLLENCPMCHKKEKHE